MIRCIDCNYALQGLDSRRCPECGRGFDPADKSTFYTGAPLGRIARRLLTPIGWPTILLVLLAVGGLASVTRWPGNLPRFSFMDFREATRLALSPERLSRWKALDSPDRIFTAAVGLSWIVAAWFAMREFLRWSVIVARRPHWRHRRVRPLRSIFVLLLIGAAVLLIGYGWPYRWARALVAEELREKPLTYRPPTPSKGIYGVDRIRTRSFAQWSPLTADELQACRTAVICLATPRQRIAGIAIYAREQPGKLVKVLVDAVASEKDPRVLCPELRLIAMHEGAVALDFFEPFLDSRDAEVRAAAIDAIGLLHGQPFDLKAGWSLGPARIEDVALDTDPPISTFPLPVVPYRASSVSLLDVTQSKAAADLVVAPPRMRKATAERLRKLISESPTLVEREAACRAVLLWPPDGYRLRIAEWGVWLNDSGNLKLAQSVIDEIPPFVHRISDPSVPLADRTVTPSIIIVNKPIIHVSASHVMPVDIDVLIRHGRPWFVYPLQDDYATEFRVFMDEYPGPSEGGPNYDPSVGPLGAISPPPGKDLIEWREGYPWIKPHHRTHTPSYRWYDGFTSLGVHWQSVVVSPQKLPWMHPPAVPADAKYAWWARLREVPCSWVSSRGESDRFLYYDGPTLLKSPNDVRWADGSLRVIHNELGGRSLLIDVLRGKVTGREYTAGLGDDHPATFQPGILEGSRVTAMLKQMLLERGLDPGEADGLIDCWTPQFFKTDGRRCLAVFGIEDYGRLCPITVRPAPTEMVRVGIVLTELGH